MLRQMERIGLRDNPQSRQYLAEHLNGVLNDTTNVVARDGGRVVRESLLMGPNGTVKLRTVWEGNNLLTIMIFGK